MTEKMPKLYTAAQLDEALTKFSKRGASLQVEAHKLCLSVLDHVGQHGDVRMVNRLITSFASMSRLNAVKAWFEMFGPVSFAKDGAVFVRGKATMLAQANAEPFWEFSPEPEYVAVDPDKAIEQLIKKLVKDGKKLVGVDHSATIGVLRQLLVARKAHLKPEPAREAARPALRLAA